MIQGVILKEIQPHFDERGQFSEIIRNTDEIFQSNFGQLSTSTVYQGVIKAWHAHDIQDQWTYILSGCLKVVLYDNRKESSTYKSLHEFICGPSHQNVVYFFPSGVLHGYKCLNGPAQVLYMTSAVYNPDEEVRISYEDVPYDWLKQNIK